MGFNEADTPAKLIDPDATRLFGKDFITTTKKPGEGPSPPGPPPPPPIIVDGFEVQVTEAGRVLQETKKRMFAA